MSGSASTVLDALVLVSLAEISQNASRAVGASPVDRSAR
jgi:hypothetical protein